ncbi:type 1 fimbrial major subunit FimA [Citrobacter sp. Awk 4]|uniref:type 1 fimbrial major subunit FimA n=1 Tax=Citrobacter sp. Awk 4 TaxID=2963955 RepID=UPI0023045E6A|nr:type 1 fimbrial major subunit FimA [Citrobacter sp. Awk 4]MDA8480759.1 type 1 fimbrial major subunit FimA [Citrobacter sp. Awk 4]
MEIKMVKVVVGVLAALSMASSAYAVTVNGGTVHFVGEVVNAACAVNADSVDQTIQLGQVRSASLATAGQTSPSVGFNIRLSDCDTTVSTQASVAFTGTAMPANADVLALQSSAAGSATNVGIQILDRTSTPLSLNGTTFSANTTLIDGTNVIPFQARYFATGAATPGQANADATFQVQYQ